MAGMGLFDREYKVYEGLGTESLFKFSNKPSGYTEDVFLF